MYAVGDEFAFDFVEGNKDNYHSEENGVWSEFAEEEMLITWMTRTRVRRFRLTTRYRQMLTRP